MITATGGGGAVGGGGGGSASTFSVPPGRDGRIIFRFRDATGTLIHQVTLGPGKFTMDVEIEGGSTG